MPIFSIIFTETYYRGHISNYGLSRQGGADVDWAYNDWTTYVRHCLSPK
jgi:choline dehydrogenase-like flavoprotein